MADIGQTLRETRMRKRIDISEVEAETKIRARYLRALENEEWDLLPGPTFVKTFLRTYADYLELDSRSLVEDYKQRFERPAAEQLTPFSTGLGGRRGGAERRRPAPQRRGIPPLAIVGGLIVIVLVALFALGTLGGGKDDKKKGPSADTPVATPTPTAAERRKQRRAEQRQAAKDKKRAAELRRRQVKLQLVALLPVNVCLVDSTGKKLLDGVTLNPGSKRKTYRSTGYRAWVGSGGQLEVHADSKTITVPQRNSTVAYRIVRGGKTLSKLSSDPKSPCR